MESITPATECDDGSSGADRYFRDGPQYGYHGGGSFVEYRFCEVSDGLGEEVGMR